jgi:hypothetical protein
VRRAIDVAEIQMLLLESRVKLVERAPQKFTVEVGIDLGGGNAFMPEHLLHRTQVCTTLDEVCCKRMSKRMW